MRIITVAAPGGPEQLKLDQAPVPEVGPAQILIRVEVAGVNRADLLQRQGFYPPPSGASQVLGLEVLGRVEAVGSQVSGWATGAECVALLAGGGYAEYVAVPSGQVIPPPAGVDKVSAGSLLEVAATALSNFDRAALAPGETVLIHGGAGGVGTFAIQYAKAIGARVGVTAGSAAKLSVCRDLGADFALDYHQDWPGGVVEATDGRGVDVILDVVGAKYLEANVACLAPDGRLVVIGLQGGRSATLDLSRLLAKRGTIMATSLRGRPDDQKAAICAAVRDRVWPLVESGAIKPLPVTAFPLDQAAQAHRYLESGEHVGKVVLTV